MVGTPTKVHPSSRIVLGTIGPAIPAAENPPSEIVRGTMGTAVPLAVNPARGMVRVVIAAPPGADFGPPATALSSQVEFPVAAGQVVTTALVTVPVSAASFAKPGEGGPASYVCTLSGYSVGTTDFAAGWNSFDPKVSKGTSPAYRVSPIPSPLTGTFSW